MKNIFLENLKKEVNTKITEGHSPLLAFVESVDLLGEAKDYPLGYIYHDKSQYTGDYTFSFYDDELVMFIRIEGKRTWKYTFENRNDYKLVKKTVTSNFLYNRKPKKHGVSDDTRNTISLLMRKHWPGTLKVIDDPSNQKQDNDSENEEWDIDDLDFGMFENHNMDEAQRYKKETGEKFKEDYDKKVLELASQGDVLFHYSNVGPKFYEQFSAFDPAGDMPNEFLGSSKATPKSKHTKKGKGQYMASLFVRSSFNTPIGMYGYTLTPGIARMLLSGRDANKKVKVSFASDRRYIYFLKFKGTKSLHISKDGEDPSYTDVDLLKDFQKLVQYINKNILPINRVDYTGSSFKKTSKILSPLIVVDNEHDLKQENINEILSLVRKELKEEFSGIKEAYEDYYDYIINSLADMNKAGNLSPSINILQKNITKAKFISLILETIDSDLNKLPIQEIWDEWITRFEGRRLTHLQRVATIGFKEYFRMLYFMPSAAGRRPEGADFLLQAFKEVLESHSYSPEEINSFKNTVVYINNLLPKTFDKFREIQEKKNLGRKRIRISITTIIYNNLYKSFGRNVIGSEGVLHKEIKELKTSLSDIRDFITHARQTLEFSGRSRLDTNQGTRYNTNIGMLWWMIYFISKNLEQTKRTTIVSSKLLRKVLGYEAVFDFGSKLLHENEPYQGVILDTSKYEVIYAHENPKIKNTYNVFYNALEDTEEKLKFEYSNAVAQTKNVFLKEKNALYSKTTMNANPAKHYVYYAKSDKPIQFFDNKETYMNGVTTGAGASLDRESNYTSKIKYYNQDNLKGSLFIKKKNQRQQFKLISSVPERKSYKKIISNYTPDQKSILIVDEGNSITKTFIYKSESPIIDLDRYNVNSYGNPYKSAKNYLIDMLDSPYDLFKSDFNSIDIMNIKYTRNNSQNEEYVSMKQDEQGIEFEYLFFNNQKISLENVTDLTEKLQNFRQMKEFVGLMKTNIFTSYMIKDLSESILISKLNPSFETVSVDFWELLKYMDVEIFGNKQRDSRYKTLPGLDEDDIVESISMILLICYLNTKYNVQQSEMLELIHNTKEMVNKFWAQRRNLRNGTQDE